MQLSTQSTDTETLGASISGVGRRRTFPGHADPTCRVRSKACELDHNVRGDSRRRIIPAPSAAHGGQAAKRKHTTTLIVSLQGRSRPIFIGTVRGRSHTGSFI